MLGRIYRAGRHSYRELLVSHLPGFSIGLGGKFRKSGAKDKLLLGLQANDEQDMSNGISENEANAVIGQATLRQFCAKSFDKAYPFEGYFPRIKRLSAR